MPIVRLNLSKHKSSRRKSSGTSEVANYPALEASSECGESNAELSKPKNLFYVSGVRLTCAFFPFLSRVILLTIETPPSTHPDILHASYWPTDILLIPGNLHDDKDLVRHAKIAREGWKKYVLASASPLGAVLIATCLSVFLYLVTVAPLMSPGLENRDFHIHSNPSTVSLGAARGRPEEAVASRDAGVSAVDAKRLSGVDLLSIMMLGVQKRR
ncbi:hypothetical protein BS47DRAFT_1359663 [Hydnum rufescens UP504]|uniref:Uncharacterized protein n=1 Tax=Hydnum rufescens UP504 TaxID=1448309 RepID=A0A9P6B456_9AGAM|nr:hypothetical protein BS47DRAFT_1359663 [Hydnum rufescens UP504]